MEISIGQSSAFVTSRGRLYTQERTDLPQPFRLLWIDPLEESLTTVFHDGFFLLRACSKAEFLSIVQLQNHLGVLATNANSWAPPLASDSESPGVWAKTLHSNKLQ